jgi:hypothetical protein
MLLAHHLIMKIVIWVLVLVGIVAVGLLITEAVFGIAHYGFPTHLQ